MRRRWQAYTIMLRNGDIELEQKSLASPLQPPANGAELAGDDTIVALIKFRFRNTGSETVKAELPIAYSSNSCRLGAIGAFTRTYPYRD